MTTRYRCAACGNITRFDVTATTRTRAFHHFSVGGELSVEEPEVLSEVVEEVSCRWCSSAGAVEVLAEAGETGVGGDPADDVAEARAVRMLQRAGLVPELKFRRRVG